MKSASILTTLVTATLFAASATIATAETTVRNSPQANRTPDGVNDRPSGTPNQFAAPGGGRQEIVTTCEGPVPAMILLLSVLPVGEILHPLPTMEKVARSKGNVKTKVWGLSKKGALPPLPFSQSSYIRSANSES